MSKPHHKHSRITSQNKDTNQNSDNSTLRNILAIASISLGAIPYAYITFFKYNTSVWVAFSGSLFIVIGLSLFAHGTIKPIFLYPIALSILLILFYASSILQIGEQEPIVQPRDTLTVKNDSSQIKQPRSLVIPKKTKYSKITELDSIQQLAIYLKTRATVFVDYAKFDKLEVNKIPKVTWTMQNSGETGAHKVNILCGVKLGSGIYKSDYIRIEKDTIPEFAVLPSHYSLPPQEAYYNRALNAEELRLIQTGQKGFYFLGTVTYEDEFGKPRYTKFGFQYDTANGNAKIKYTDNK